jgi:hypothetical protein
MAPPPMIAPPQVQAHNLAKAIFTDIAKHPVQSVDAIREVLVNILRSHPADQTDAKVSERRKRVNHLVTPKPPPNGRSGCFCPNCEQCLGSGERLSRRPAAALMVNAA